MPNKPMPGQKKPSQATSKKLSTELIKHQAETTALFNSIGEGAISTDAQARINRINQIALDLLGFKKKDVIGQWFPKVIQAVTENGKSINMLDRPITKALLSGQAIVEKTNYLRTDGQILPVRVTVSPILLAGRPVGAIEVFSDITTEQEVDRMKSEFISIASHQLRTPLTAIKTYTHLLASGFKGPLTDGQQEFMEIILGSIDRMNDLINILLDVSRIEGGKIEIVLKPTNIKKLVGEIVSELSNFASDKKIKIKVNGPDQALTVKIDQILTTEIIANLLTNAIKYSPPKSTITLEIKEKAEELFFSIEDQGYGIPASDHVRVFSKFYRGDNIKRKEPSGTGLGLYMVQQIIENLRGEIWFKSREGKGTTFFFTLPKS